MSRTIKRAALALVPCLLAFGGLPAHAQPAGCPTLLRHTFNQLQTGQAQSLCQYQGKVLLIVNTASKCGYTPQYEGLEALYRKYKDRGLVVVGFPVQRLRRPGAGQQQGNRRVLPHHLWRAVPALREDLRDRAVPQSAL